MDLNKNQFLLFYYFNVFCSIFQMYSALIDPCYFSSNILTLYLQYKLVQASFPPFF